MARWLLILLLATTQLLSWSGRSLYLCLSGDGSYCCVDAGPGECDCHHHHDDCCSDFDCSTLKPSCGDHDQDELFPSQLASILASDSNCCTHILIVSGESPTSLPVSKNFLGSDRSLVDPFDVLTPAPFIAIAGGNSSAQPVPHQADSLALTVLATVVLRC